MVVGDRLWLFSQPPHGPPAPIQSLLLNNVPPTPQHISSVHPSVLTRTYAPPMMPRQNQGFNMNSTSFMNKQVRHEYLSKLQYSPYNRPTSDPVEFCYGSKSILVTSKMQLDGISQDSSSSELANLESRFGNNSSILSVNKFQEAIKIHDDARSSSSSEIDCGIED